MVLRLRVSLVVFATLFGFGVLVAGLGSGQANAAAGDGDFTNHPGLVPEIPQRNYPTILTTPDNNGDPRQTYAIDLIGPYIVSGGDFLQISEPNGNTVSQPYLAVFDSRDKSLTCTNLDVDDEVLAIAPGPDANTAFIAGRFDRVNGSDGVDRVRNKIALVDLDDCSVDRTWIVEGLNGRVTEMAVTGNRLFIAGDFSSVEGTNIGNIAEVNLNTGALNTSFDPNFGGALTRAVVAMEASPDGSRLGIVHRATSIMGQSMRGTAIFNISNPSNITVTNHRLDQNAGEGDGAGRVWDRYDRIQDGAISPDFSTIIVAQGPGSDQDYVTAVPTVEQNTDARWQLWMRDTTFSAAATNDIVYVAGHFCKIDGGPGDAAVLSPNGGPSNCDGNDQDDGVFRTQMAALDINDGTPLNWNPGNNALVGARALTVVDRGLLVGYDGDRINDVLVGTTGFFDFGAPDIPDPRDNLTCSATVDGATVNLAWNDIDGVDFYIVRRNAQWVASPGSALSYADTPPAGTHTYYIRTWYQDVQRDVTCNPLVTVAAQSQTCIATLQDDNTVLVEWTALAGEDTYNVRRNGGWIATASGGDTSIVDQPASGIYTYVVRSRQNGRNTITTCTPGSIVVSNAGQTCTATVQNNGNVLVEWTAIAGEDIYNVRRNNAWVGDATGGATSFVVTDHSPGDIYSIRSRQAGVTTDTNCA